jgi:hypothetical protein
LAVIETEPGASAASPQSPLATAMPLLELFLESRTSWISKALAASASRPPGASATGGSAWASDVLSRLRTALRTVRRTVVDVRRIFVVEGAAENGATSPGSESLLAKRVAALRVVEAAAVARQSDEPSQRPVAPPTLALPSVDQVKEHTTSWLVAQVLLLLESSRERLRVATSAAALAGIRQVLWDEASLSSATPTDSAVSSTALALATAEPVDAAPAATPAARWASDCSMVLDAKKLAAGLGDADVRSPPPSAALGERSRWDGAASGRGLLSAERGLDLWSLLFSRAFSELGEGILQSSLEHIRADVEARLTTVLGYIVAGPLPVIDDDGSSREAAADATQPKRTSTRKSAEKRTEEVFAAPRAPLSWNGLPAGRPSHEIAYAAEMVVDLLERQLEALAADSRSLVQHGDAGAAIDLTKSLYLRAVEMVSYLVNRLRRTCDALGKAAFEALKAAAAATALAVGDAPSIAGAASAPTVLAKSSAGQEAIRGDAIKAWYESTKRRTKAPASSTSDAQKRINAGSATLTMQQHLESATRHLDGLILVARFARGLRSQDSVLRTLLRVPDALRLPSPDRVGIEQLQAAFIVTDNDGDGKLDAREVRDAVDSVLACGHLLTLDEAKMPSVTFSEFALIATGMLESQEPFVHLSACLDELFVKAHATWAKVVIKSPRASFAAGLSSLAASAEKQEVSTSFAGSALQPPPPVSVADFEKLWREENGSWMEKPAVLGSDALASPGGTADPPMFVPSSVSGPLHRFLFTVASELNRVTNASDYLPISYMDLLETQTEGEASGASEGGEEDDGFGGAPKVGNVAVHLRNVLSSEVLDALAEVYHDLSMTIATMDNCTESCIVQLLMDATFLTQWIGGVSDDRSSKFFSVEANLRRWVDPVNMELLKPHLGAVSKRFYGNNQIYLNLIISPSEPTGRWATAVEVAGRDSEDDGDANILTLAPKVARFALLPIPLDFTNGGTSGEGSNDGGFHKGDGLRMMDQLGSSRGRKDDDSSAGAFGLLNNLRFKW